MNKKDLNGFALDFVRLHDLYNTKDMGMVLKHIEGLLKQEFNTNIEEVLACNVKSGNVMVLNFPNEPYIKITKTNYDTICTEVSRMQRENELKWRVIK